MPTSPLCTVRVLQSLNGPYVRLEVEYVSAPFGNDNSCRLRIVRHRAEDGEARSFTHLRAVKVGADQPVDGSTTLSLSGQRLHSIHKVSRVYMVTLLKVNEQVLACVV